MGVSGISSDMRKLRASQDPAAAEAIALFVYRIVREIGSLAAALGGLDGLIFTGGIGENDAAVRAEVAEGCRWLGVELDETRNTRGAGPDQCRPFARRGLGHSDRRGTHGRPPHVGPALAPRSGLIRRQDHESKKTLAPANAPLPDLKKKTYEKELKKLQVELCHLQEWVKKTGARIILLFEGRDAAGKGGIIKAITERVSPRVFQIVALPAPTDREKTQMYMQRYIRPFSRGGRNRRLRPQLVQPRGRRICDEVLHQGAASALPEADARWSRNGSPIPASS